MQRAVCVPPTRSNNGGHQYFSSCIITFQDSDYAFCVEGSPDSDMEARKQNMFLFEKIIVDYNIL